MYVRFVLVTSTLDKIIYSPPLLCIVRPPVLIVLNVRYSLTEGQIWYSA